MHCQSCFGGRSRRTAEQTVLVPTYLLQAVFRNQGACHRRRTRYPYDIPARDVGDVACGFPGGLRQVYGGVASSLGQVLDQLLENKVGRHLLICIPSLRGKTPQDLRCTVPLIIHGDAVPYAKKQSAMFGQWGSLLGPNIVSAKLRVSKVGPT